MEAKIPGKEAMKMLEVNNFIACSYLDAYLRWFDITYHQRQGPELSIS